MRGHSPGAVATGTFLNIWDTIDDYNGGDLTFLSVFPNASLPGSWTSSNFCTGVEVTAGDDNVWKDVTTTGNGITPSTCAETTDHCTFQDKISGLHWSKNQSSVNQQLWMSGLNICDILVHNGFSDWRLPTQKELMDAYNHGIRSVTRANWITDSEMANGFLSSSSFSGSTSDYIFVNLKLGFVGNYTKSSGQHMVVCVRLLGQGSSKNRAQPPPYLIGRSIIKPCKKTIRGLLTPRGCQRAKSVRVDTDDPPIEPAQDWTARVATA